MDGRAESNGRLQGWAEIERYLKLTRNTIKARGYPFRKKRGVFAFIAELDEHDKNCSTKNSTDSISH